MSDTLTVNDQPSDPPAGFVPVRVSTLRGSQTTAVELFMQYEPGAQPRPYCRAGSRPDEQQFTELETDGVEFLYVRSGDFREFSNDLLESLDVMLQQPTIPTAEKFAALQQAVAVAVEQSLRLVDSNKFHALTKKVGNDVVSLLASGDVLPRELFRLARHDFNAFTHLTNVASYSVILAQNAGITDSTELQKIASAAMLHDLGKRYIPAGILTKAGPLSPDERSVVESHPRLGYVELCENSDLDFGQLMMIYQHHERADGTGYPVRIPQNEIHPWARMLAIVDVFDTMTAKRPNRRSDPPENVLEYQRQQAETHFDGELVECWISAMTKV